jgi:hypothetical protein
VRFFLFEKKVKPWRFKQTVTEVQRCRLELAAGNLEVRANQAPDLSCQRRKEYKEPKVGLVVNLAVRDYAPDSTCHYKT